MRARRWRCGGTNGSGRSDRSSRAVLYGDSRNCGLNRLTELISRQKPRCGISAWFCRDGTSDLFFCGFLPIRWKRPDRNRCQLTALTASGRLVIAKAFAGFVPPGSFLLPLPFPFKIVLFRLVVPVTKLNDHACE